MYNGMGFSHNRNVPSGIRPTLQLDFLGNTLDSRITFSRASTATYIGSDGRLSTASSNIPRFDYGPITPADSGMRGVELAVSFTPGATSSYSGGVVSTAGTSSFGTIFSVPGVNYVVGKTYYIKATVSRTSGSNVVFQIGSQNALIVTGGSGSFSGYFVANNTGTLGCIEGNGVTWAGNISNVSVKEIIPATTGVELAPLLNSSSWGTAAGWTFDSANNLIISGAASFSFINSNTAPLRIGKTYRVSFKVSNFSGSYIRIGPSAQQGVSNVTATGNGNFSGNITSTIDNVQLTWQNGASSGGIISNLSVQEVTFTTKGMWIEESRTNLITNGQCIGASGSAFPTGHSADQGYAGLAPASFSSTTTPRGYGAVQFTISGTTTGTNQLLYCPSGTSGVLTPVAANTAVSISYNMMVAAGTYPSSNALQIVILWYDSGSVLLSAVSGTSVVPSTTEQRVSDTFTSPATAAFMRVRIASPFMPISGTVVNFTLKIGGFQLEVGSSSTSYIPTTGTTNTRAADIMSVTGTNFSSWFNASTGTFYAESDSISYSSTPIQMILSGTSGANVGFNSPGSGSSRWFNNSANIVTSNGIAAGLVRKEAMAYTSTSRTIVLAGGNTTTDAAAPWVSESPNRLIIGSNQNNTGQFLNGHIRRIAFYPRALTSAELQSLTA